MAHISAIEDALDDRDLPAIQQAFRHLVQWSVTDRVEGAEDARDLSHLLDRVTAALEADRTLMPADLAESITRLTHDTVWLRDGTSYAAGARAVAAQSLLWRAFFESCLRDPEPDDAGSLA